MAQRPTRRGRPHCEAFPAMDIVAGKRSLVAGGGFCVWQDEHGRHVGRGQLVGLDTDAATFKFSFLGSPNIARTTGVVTLPVRNTQRNVHVVRTSFVCPSCTGGADKIFFISGSWACRKCHGLVYLKQRLSDVNDPIFYRDSLAKKLADGADDKIRTRAEYNKRRHLERINRDLEARNLTSLPQELLYRTEQIWVDVSSPADTPFEAGEPNASFTNADEDDAPAALAYFRPAPVFPERTNPGELVGSLILHRGFETALVKWKADQGERLLREIRAGIMGRERVTRERFAGMLAERLCIRPVRIAGDWGDVIETVGPTGRAEFAICAAYVGDATFWPIGPGTKPYKRELRAILDDTTVTLQVRVADIGSADPEAELIFYREELERRLELLDEKLMGFNASRKRVAEMWTHYRAPRVAKQVRKGFRRTG